MQVYLVRHTETVCEKGICYGQSDVALMSYFEPNFITIKKQLPEKAIVFSSPLIRCTQLATYCYPDDTLILEPRLMEMNFGAWELQTWSSIPENELNPWMEDFVKVPVPQGESFEILYDRVVAFWNEIRLQHSDMPIVIFTHAGVIRSLNCLFTQLPLQEAFTLKVDFGEVIKYSF